MYRRRATDEDDDSAELVRDGENNGESSEGNFNTAIRLKEEKHNVPKRLSVLKLRIAAKTSSPKGKLLCWWITVALLGLVALIFVLVPLIIERGKRKGCSDYLNYTYGAVREQPELPFFFQRDDGYFEICRGGKSVLAGNLGINRSLISEVKVNAYQDLSGAMLNITNLPYHEDHCIRIVWTGTSSKQYPLQDCYQFGTDVHWYGAYEQLHQKWPINLNFSVPFTNVPFVPMDISSKDGTFGSVLQPFWLTSVGVGILVDRGIQLHVSMNSSHVCLSALPSHVECGSNLNGHSSLNYTICSFETTSQVAQFFLGASHMIPRPNELPESYLFEAPVWTNPVETEVTQFLTNEVLQTCNEITSLGMPISQLVIGNENSLNFQNSLQNTGASSTLLNSSSCSYLNLSVWVHPYVNYNWNNFAVGLKNDYYLPGQGGVNGNVVSLIRWSGDFGAVTNFFNADAKENYMNELNNLTRMTRVSSFNFHGGHYNYLPKCTYIDGLEGYSGSFAEAYINFVSNQSYSKRSSVGVGFYTQDKPVFVRLSRNMAQNSSDVLSSLISTVLSAGLGGYFFIIPDVVAGFESCYAVDSPCFKLYVRWVQLSTFFPVMHFTVMPQTFNNTTLFQHLKSLSSLHNYLNFTSLAEDAIQSGFPIVRPLWWRGSDQMTLTISDQFYIGDNFMVAPILDSESDNRTVYFPVGSSYKLLNHMLVPQKSPCPSNNCSGGQFFSFKVTLYNVLIFIVV